MNWGTIAGAVLGMALLLCFATAATPDWMGGVAVCSGALVGGITYAWAITRRLRARAIIGRTDIRKGSANIGP